MGEGEGNLPRQFFSTWMKHLKQYYLYFLQLYELPLQGKTYKEPCNQLSLSIQKPSFRNLPDLQLQNYCIYLQPAPRCL